MWKIQADVEDPNKKMLSSVLAPGLDWKFDDNKVVPNSSSKLYFEHLSQGHWSQLLCLQGLFQAQYQLLRPSMPLSCVSKLRHTRFGQWNQSKAHQNWPKNLQPTKHWLKVKKYSHQTSCCWCPQSSLYSTPPSVSPPLTEPPSGHSEKANLFSRTYLVYF